MSIEISPLLEAAWGILKFLIDYGYLLCLLIFLLIFINGLSDIVGDIIQTWKGKLPFKNKKIRRYRE